MKNQVREFVALVGIFGLFLFAVAHCGPFATRENAERTYQAQLLRCVDKAETLEESRACRAKVDSEWHVDAGKE